MPRKKSTAPVALATAVNYLQCRVMKHDWVNVTGNTAPVHKRTPTLSSRRITLRCATCTMIREDIWSWDWQMLISRVYQAPEGYKIVYEEGVDTKLKGADFRAMYFGQFIDG